MNKRYLGDGAYVRFDGFMLILTAEDGVKITDEIALEPAVYNALVEYVAELSKSRRAGYFRVGGE